MIHACILVIDDDPGVFETVQDCLGDRFDLVHAGNGEEGLQLFKERDPDLIILDMRMPVMDGITFLERIHTTPDDLFSIIVLTGHAHGPEIKRCFDMGITAFLRKPFDFYELKGLVKQSIIAKNLLNRLATENRFLTEELNEWEVSSGGRDA